MLDCCCRASWTSNSAFGALIEQHLTDPRSGRNRQFPLVDLFRQSIYSRLAGYGGHQRRGAAGSGSDVSDAGRA